MTLKTYELPEVQQFVEQLKVDRIDCLEGRFCSRLDKQIACQLRVCRALTEAITTWTSRVFRGQIPHDQAVELALREQIAETLETALGVVKRGREREAECYVFARLNDLEKYVRRLHDLEVKWVTPRLAARPVFRKDLTPDEIAALRAGFSGSPVAAK